MQAGSLPWGKILFLCHCLEPFFVTFALSGIFSQSIRDFTGFLVFAMPARVWKCRSVRDVQNRTASQKRFS
jgi:hypothetical protein